MRPARSWLLACVLPWLSSCGSVQTVAVPVPQTVRVLPPLTLLDCPPLPPPPVAESPTVRDVVVALLDARGAHAVCRASMDRLLEWRAGEVEPGQGAE